MDNNEYIILFLMFVIAVLVTHLQTVRSEQDKLHKAIDNMSLTPLPKKV
jgi:hypothetical protein